MYFLVNSEKDMSLASHLIYLTSSLHQGYTINSNKVIVPQDLVFYFFPRLRSKDNIFFLGT